MAEVRPRQVERLRIPCIDLGRKTKRYLVQDVLAWLDVKRAGGGQAGDTRDKARVTSRLPTG